MPVDEHNHSLNELVPAPLEKPETAEKVEGNEDLDEVADEEATNNAFVEFEIDLPEEQKLLLENEDL